jgi:uncharacterized membrane protein YgcG
MHISHRDIFFNLFLSTQRIELILIFITFYCYIYFILFFILKYHMYNFTFRSLSVVFVINWLPQHPRCFYSPGDEPRTEGFHSHSRSCRLSRAREKHQVMAAMQRPKKEEKPSSTGSGFGCGGLGGSSGGCEDTRGGSGGGGSK